MLKQFDNFPLGELENVKLFLSLSTCCKLQDTIRITLEITCDSSNGVIPPFFVGHPAISCYLTLSNTFILMAKTFYEDECLHKVRECGNKENLMEAVVGVVSHLKSIKETGLIDSHKFWRNRRKIREEHNERIKKEKQTEVLKLFKLFENVKILLKSQEKEECKLAFRQYDSGVFCYAIKDTPHTKGSFALFECEYVVDGGFYLLRVENRFREEFTFESLKTPSLGEILLDVAQAINSAR